MLAALKPGPMTTKELKELGVKHGYTEDQIGKLIAPRWMDLPRHPGRTYYDPWTVYHPFDAHADRLGISHGIDRWLVAYLGDQGRPVASTKIEAAAEAAGFDVSVLKSAYRRCQAVATKNGKHWYRHIAKVQSHAGAAASRRMKAK